MNIEILLSKISSDTTPEVTIEFADYKRTVRIVGLNEIVKFDVEHNKDNQLVVSRSEADLYRTRFNYHTNKVSIDKVIVDDFWEFNSTFYTPHSILDTEYSSHANKVGEGEWISDALVYNTTLFFNGKLVWEIKYPVRRSIFKDYNR
jgi:hypothetical protein